MWSQQAAEPRGDDARDIAGEIHQNRCLGAQLGDGCERGARITGEEDPGHDRQVARGRDRQKLGQTLHNGQYDNLPPRHRLHRMHDDDRTGCPPSLQQTALGRI